MLACFQGAAWAHQYDTVDHVLKHSTRCGRLSVGLELEAKSTGEKLQLVRKVACVYPGRACKTGTSGPSMYKGNVGTSKAEEEAPLVRTLSQPQACSCSNASLRGWCSQLRVRWTSG